MDTEKILKEAHSNGYDLGRKERTKQILELEIPEKAWKGLREFEVEVIFKFKKKKVKKKCV